MSFLQELPILIAAFVPALTFHEWAHGIVAKFFGDDTAQRQGRLTLNPLAHLDPLGTLCVILAGFGWAKPVPIDPRNFRNSWAEFWVASAGPLMNIVLALIFAVLFRWGAMAWFGETQIQNISDILLASIQLNLALAIFNLIPIGPLDGSHLLSRLLPLSSSIRFNLWNAQYGGLVLMGVVLAEMLLHIPILKFIIGVPVIAFERFLLA